MVQANYSEIDYGEGGSITAIVFGDEEQASSLLYEVTALAKQSSIEVSNSVEPGSSAAVIQWTRIQSKSDG